jgi:hypothetical protein
LRTVRTQLRDERIDLAALSLSVPLSAEQLKP